MCKHSIIQIDYTCFSCITAYNLNEYPTVFKNEREDRDMSFLGKKLSASFLTNATIRQTGRACEVHMKDSLMSHTAAKPAWN